ncbi:Potassium voltage-gated channel subfamily C member 2 [Liparis tanakae]|uniref:Potassium voltage-gated channel subfamily C member 2 n=1 Tax=Liparis tanakae TaxID=230148 RepID=A0A4Z2FBL6_9TELE|nr:Potassium voltage-gated channel subfamily C member 2 [Liparis tanakae]
MKMKRNTYLTLTWEKGCLSSAPGYEKSRSLNNISGMTGAPLRLAPVTNSPFEPFEPFEPAGLRRCRSPIPSIL